MAAPVLQFKRGLLANLPGLRAGEPGFTTDSYDLYVGLTSETSTNKFFGSHRYWTKETTSTGSGINVVEGTSNGSSYITLKAPDSLAGVGTYILPDTNSIVDGYFLKVASNGSLSWDTVGGTNGNFTNPTLTGITTINGILDNNANTDFSGITTFSNTTDNTLGDADTGAVQIDGGLGVNKNVTVGGNLHVEGYSNFVGVVTFQGGTINLGDSDADDINVAGEFISNLVPNSDDTYDIGDGANTKSWRHASFSGIGTFATGAAIDAVQIGISGVSEIDTSSGNLTIDSADGTVIIDDNLSVSGISTFAGEIAVDDGANITGQVTLNNNLDVSGVSTFSGAVNVLNSVSANNFISTSTTLQPPTSGDYTGERLRLYDFNDPSKPNYAIGVEQNNIWVGVDTNLHNQGFKWYGGETEVARLGGTGNLRISGYLNVEGAGISTISGFLDANGGLDVLGHSELDTANVSIALTTTELTVGSGVGITQFASSVGSGTSTSSVPTSSAVIDYVAAADIGLSADTGSGSVNTTQTLTISGTAEEIETSASGQTITIGLPNDVVVGTSLSSPTIKTATIQHSNGTEAVTIDALGNVGVSSNLTVSGNLYVNGSTTQVNTTSLSVEDRTIELGIVDGSAPSAATTWDLGVLFNYYTDSAKKSAVVWEQSDARFKFASVVSDGGGSDNDSPQITIGTGDYAPIEIGALWVNDCAGSSQVISCTGTERFLENITVDAGTF